MARLRRYTDPTLPVSKTSVVRYGTGGRKIVSYDVDGSPIYDVEADSPTTIAQATANMAPAQVHGSLRPVNFALTPDQELSSGRKKLNLSGLNDVLPYASNLVNSFRKLPLPIAPNLESGITPNLVNYDATRGIINNKLASFNAETDYKTNNSTIGQALKAKALAGGIEGYNQAAQQEGNTNSIIKNQTNQFNQGVQARNINRTQEYNDNLVSRQLKQQELNSENLADVVDKFQLQRKDKNAQYQEGERNYINALGIDRSLLGQTAIDKLDELNETQRKRLGYNKFGGKLKKYPDGGKIDPNKLKFPQAGDRLATFKEIGVNDSTALYNKGIRPYRNITNSLESPIIKGKGLGRTASDTEYVGEEFPTRLDFAYKENYGQKVGKAILSPAFRSLALKEGYKAPDDFAAALIKEYDTESGTKYDVDTYSYRKPVRTGVKAPVTRHNELGFPTKFPDGKDVKYVSLNRKLGGKLRF